jgi:hypothetical protein
MKTFMPINLKPVEIYKFIERLKQANIFKKLKEMPGMVAHICNPS